jgi:hypothetical protein
LLPCLQQAGNYSLLITNYSFKKIPHGDFNAVKEGIVTPVPFTEHMLRTAF